MKELTLILALGLALASCAGDSGGVSETFSEVSSGLDQGGSDPSAIPPEQSRPGDDGAQVIDPAEETFPYGGRIEFEEPEGLGSITIGRAEAWKDDFIRRVALHRDAIRAEFAAKTKGIVYKPSIPDGPPPVPKQ